MQSTHFFSAVNIANFIRKKNDSFNILAQNIDCGSNEYPQSLFWTINKKNKIGIPCIPQFYYIKVVFKRVFIALTCFPYP